MRVDSHRGFCRASARCRGADEVCTRRDSGDAVRRDDLIVLRRDGATEALMSVRPPPRGQEPIPPLG